MKKLTLLWIAFHILTSSVFAVTVVPKKPSPLRMQITIPAETYAFSIVDIPDLGSVQVTGSIPPGLSLFGLTAPGLKNFFFASGASAQFFWENSLVGTPSSIGTYTIGLQAWSGQDRTGNASPILSYTIIVGGILPQITTQPQSQIVAMLGSATLTVAASGNPTPTFQWQKNGANISGATNATLTLSSVQSNDTGSYSVVVTNIAGTVTSAAATVTLTTPPAISIQPVNITAQIGQPARLTVEATGNPSPAYQWRRDGVNISVARSSSYTINSVTAGDAGSYDVVVTNSGGTVISSAATLTVNAPPPTITTQPANQTVPPGSGVTFSIVATNPLPLTYQWRKDGAAIVGATSATLALPNVQPADAGNYTVIVTNTAGLVTTRAATLTVNFSRLINISTRALVLAGGYLAPGFVLRGVGNKQLVIRAVGPTLSLFGISSPLGDPKFDVFRQGASTPFLSNDDWGGTASLTSGFAGVGAFPFNTNSKDAALLTSLTNSNVGAYTVQIAPGVAATSGIALAEIYDADAVTSVRLINLSTFGFAGTGENVLTAGFVISGNVPKQLLIRAIGPGLAPFGATGLLADPQLQVIPSGQSSVVASNNHWGGTALLKAAFAQAGAFALGDTSNDSAVVVQLPPGGYTVLITGVGSTMGNALVEIYDLDP